MSALRAASTLVALESFTQVTPATTPTTWRRWTTPGNVRRVRAMSDAATPIAAAAAAAASELARLCSPFSASSPAPHSSSGPAPVCSHSAPAVTPASSGKASRSPTAPPRGAGARRENAPRRALPGSPAAATAVTPGSSAFTRARSAEVWFSKMRSLASTYSA